MMDAAAFDARYVGGVDPWAYRTSEYERAKYRATLMACGPGPFRSALELGASIGIFSAMLAPRCAHLTTVDFSGVAAEQARRHLAGISGVDVRVAEIPWELESRRHDLVVASEVLYYLTPTALAATLTWLKQGLDDRARLVIVHWRPAGPERPFSAQEVHEEVLDQPWLRLREEHSSDDYLLHVLERR